MLCTCPYLAPRRCSGDQRRTLPFLTCILVTHFLPIWSHCFDLQWVASKNRSFCCFCCFCCCCALPVQIPLASTQHQRYGQIICIRLVPNVCLH
jgi:hypothetical protein